MMRIREVFGIDLNCLVKPLDNYTAGGIVDKIEYYLSEKRQ